MASVGIFYLIFSLLCGVISQESSQNGSLALLHLIFRHGDRNPTTHVGPNDPYASASHWPGGFGALNNMGKQRMFRLGEYIRTRYDHFLGPFSDETVKVRSTDKSRNLMSAECVLAGLYPPMEDQVWNEDLLWQPIPVHTVPIKEDILLYHDAECPAFSEDQELFINSPEVEKLLQENLTKLENFKFMTGLPDVTIKDIVLFSQTIDIQVKNNMTPPSWVYEFYHDWVDPFDDIYCKEAFTYTTRMKNIRCGPMFEEWKTHLLQLKEGTLNGTRLFLYSAHDINIFSLLTCMGYETPWDPPCGSFIVTEVYEKPGQEYFVRILFRNGTDSEPIPLHFMGCDLDCPMETFISSLNTYIPASMNQECFGSPTGNDVDSHPFVTIALIGLAYMVFVIFIIIFCVWKRPSRRSTYQMLQ